MLVICAAVGGHQGFYRTDTRFNRFVKQHRNQNQRKFLITPDLNETAHILFSLFIYTLNPYLIVLWINFYGPNQCEYPRSFPRTTLISIIYTIDSATVQQSVRSYTSSLKKTTGKMRLVEVLQQSSNPNCLFAKIVHGEQTIYYKNDIKNSPFSINHLSNSYMAWRVRFTRCCRFRPLCHSHMQLERVDE